MKNYMFAGLMIAYTQDGKAEEVDKQAAAALMLQNMDDGQGKLDMAKAAQLDHVVGHCSMKLGAKEAYVNLKMHESHTRWGLQLGDALLRVGRRQWDAPTPTPVAKELRKRAEELRRR